MVELLDDAPATIRRPLAIIDGRAYAAIWPHVKMTRTEGLDKSGNIVKLNPPVVTKEQRLLLVRDDGCIFGDGGDKPLMQLGLDVYFPEVPPTEKLWSTPAVKVYHNGVRPNPADVFSRIVATVNTFIDFDRSLADQCSMCELVACYILTTWFLDAFNVIGFLWPNGDRGSGKTQLLLVITELAYLGQTILAGGSFAALRDLADYGACLAFDDAENFSDPRRTDPDKRNLLLAGNRRGNTVPMKEPGPDRTWKTRHVHTFCPRLFSAIRIPDPALASRSIVLPLIRTIDRTKANADPLDYKLWPHDRRKLIDDCWALGLEHLPKLSRYETLVNDQATLAGRALEPWRALLAVAIWLDNNGVKGLGERMNNLSQAYQSERPDIESSDLTALVIHALCSCAISAINSISAIKIETPPEWNFTTAQVTEATKTVIVETEIDLDADKISSRRIGRVLGRMRLKQAPRSGGKGSRKWTVSLTDLQRWATLYGAPLPDSLMPPPPFVNGTNGGNGTNGTPDPLPVSDAEVL